MNNKKKDKMKNGKNCFEELEIVDMENKYKELLEKWKKVYYEYIKTLEIINKALQEERCLFKRLLEYKEEHILFIKIFNVSFDNNMAERVLRLIKTKKNVSGGIRSKNLE